jgi:nitrile hydratase beta subunit
MLRHGLLCGVSACYAMRMDGVHDVGGMHGFGAVVVPGSGAPYHERWEAHVFALYLLVAIEGLGGAPSGRATREQMEPSHYLAASYYERWLWSAERQLERKGTIRPGEVERMAQRLEGHGHGLEEQARHDDQPQPPRPGDLDQARRALEELRRPEPMPAPAEPPRFAPGDRVRVRRMRPARHTRCPRYVRGAAGVVERVQGRDLLPELAAYREEGVPEPVYAVRFSSETLFGRDGRPPWTVVVDLWESYLEERPDD